MKKKYRQSMHFLKILIEESVMQRFLVRRLFFKEMLSLLQTQEIAWRVPSWFGS